MFFTSLLVTMQNMTVQAALQAADQMLEGIEGSHTVLRVIIDNMLYPITVDILKQVSLQLLTHCHYRSVCISQLMQGFPLTWKARELILLGNFVDCLGKVMCIVQVVWLFIFVEKYENTRLVNVITKWWFKGIGVKEEELTKNYMGQGIMPNTVGESTWISVSCMKLSGNPEWQHVCPISCTIGLIHFPSGWCKRRQNRTLVLLGLVFSVCVEFL